MGIDIEVKKGISWLSTDEKFERIQSIFKANRFGCAKLDLSDTESVERAAKIMSGSGVDVDYVYISDVAEFIKPNKRGAYMKSKVN